MIAFIQNVGIVPLIVIGIIAFLIFGSQLPKMALNVGRSFFSLKKGMAEGRKELAEIESAIKEIPGDDERV